MKRAKKQQQIWTIGHSTHTLDEFVAMLKSFNIDVVADIRSFPGSRRYPHFNKENLEGRYRKTALNTSTLKTLAEEGKCSQTL
jgi:uncharacterized protein (DUF488 family)